MAYTKEELEFINTSSATYTNPKYLIEDWNQKEAGALELMLNEASRIRARSKELYLQSICLLDAMDQYRATLEEEEN